MIIFDNFVRQNKVLKRDKDLALRNSLLKDAEERIKILVITGLSPKFKFEQAYDAVRELADSFLARDGFKTYSHEAALSYLNKLGLIDDVELERLDMCRKKRNDSKYYGKDIDDEEAIYLCKFLENIFNRLKK
jgi:hypothetical protein